MGVESLDWGTHPQRGLEGGEQQSRALIAAEMSPETGLISSGNLRKMVTSSQKDIFCFISGAWRGAEQGLGSLA